VYIGDTYNNRVRKITASTSIITTIAGTGSYGFSGDGGAATAAATAYPQGINLDSSGNIYFGDRGAYNVVRKIPMSTGIISIVAGTGSASGGYNGDNIQATAATLSGPYDVVLDSYNNLYICDGGNYRIRKVDVSTGVITTIVGTGIASSTGDGGAATSATINAPKFSRFDSSGNYYISDGAGNRVRKVVTVSTNIPTASPSYIPR
jgi:sugar lactone lactonase YvrE